MTRLGDIEARYTDFRNYGDERERISDEDTEWLITVARAAEAAAHHRIEDRDCW